MKYKVGDKVVIKSDNSRNSRWNGEMDEYKGVIMTIDDIDPVSGDYHMLEDDDAWYWDDTMIDHETTKKLNVDHHSETLNTNYTDDQIISALNIIKGVCKGRGEDNSCWECPLGDGNCNCMIVDSSTPDEWNIVTPTNRFLK